MSSESTQASQLEQTIREADVVILLSDKGRSGMTYFKGLGTVPCEVEVSYGEADDPSLTIRRVVVRAGWTQKQWRQLDRGALQREEPTDG